MNVYDVVLEVLKTESFSKAAQNLDYSQSAVSQAVKSFEDSLGFSIFKRSTSGVKLAPCGKKVIESIRTIRREQERLIQISDAITKVENGTVRLGLFFSFATTYFPDILKKFKEEHPNIKFIIYTDNQDQINEKLDSGEIDIAFTSKAAIDDKRYVFTEVFRDEFVAILPQNSDLSTASSISIHELKGMEYIISGEKLDFEIGNILHDADIIPTNTLEVEDELVALKFIEAGFGVSIHSKFFMESIPNYVHVVIRPFKEHYYRSLVIATNPDNYLPAASKVFKEYMEKWLEVNAENLQYAWS